MSEQETKEKTGILGTLFANKKGKSRLVYFIAIVLAAAVILIYFSSFTEEKAVSDGAALKAAEEYGRDDVKSGVEEILSGIKGAGAVSVMITYCGSAEMVPAVSTTTETSGETQESGGNKREQKDIVTIQNSGEESALVLKELAPDIKGVVVTAQGAGDIGVRQNILKAVTTLLDITADKVEVFEKNE